MKRIKIFKAYFVLWLFVYFIAVANWDTFVTYFTSTLTFNIAIVSLLTIGTIMLLKAAKEVTMLAGTFGVLMYKKKNISFYLKGIEKILPTNFAQKIVKRVEAGNLMFTQQEKEDLLAWMSDTFANQNKYNNFFIGTVLMIGLLGTFAGLLGAIGSMGGIVKSLAGSNVDIGKIMAGFAGPLGSMAVGFGSSLFGVISAILMSIKGYLLNKAQANLSEGVEDWLNKITLEVAPDESGAVALTPANTLEAHQESFVDIFLEKISLLTKEINQVANSNKKVEAKLSSVIEMMFTKMQEEKKINKELSQGVKKLLEQSSNINLYIEKNNKYSKASVILQKDLLEEIKTYKDSFKNIEQTQKGLIKKQEQNSLDIYQIVEALSQQKSEYSKLKDLIESEKKIYKDDTQRVDFMKNHFENSLKLKEEEYYG